MCFVSCSEVPEDVISRTEEQHARESAAAADSKAYAESDFDPYAKVSLAEVKAELNGYKFKAHDNLTFKCEPTAIEAESVFDLTMTYGLNTEADEGDFQRMKSLNKAVFDRNVPDDMLRVTPYAKNMVEAADYDKNLNYGVVCHDSPSFEIYNFDNSLTEIITDIKLKNYTPNDYPKDTIKMIDGSEFTVVRAVEQADGYLKKLREAGAFDNGETQKLSHVAVGDQGGKGCIICVHYSQCRHGIAVEDANVCTTQTRTGFFEVWFYGDNDPFVITNYCSGTETSKTEITEMIPLSGAEYLVADGLAPDMAYDVTAAELRYLCLWDIGDLKEELKYHPMWCFTLEELPDVLYARYFERKTLYIDAITGELYYCDPSKGQFLSAAELKFADI
jgi:hypothetical protein